MFRDNNFSVVCILSHFENVSGSFIVLIVLKLIFFTVAKAVADNS